MKSCFRAALALGLLLTACTPPGAPPAPPLPPVRVLDFSAFDTQQGSLGLRPGPSGRLSLDAEPEFVTVSPDSTTAWVTLQESNAVATVDLTSGRVVALRSLGLKDHSLPGNALDASDQDGGVALRNWPVRGAYMPDHIAQVSVGGRSYLLTANEGNPRGENLASSDEVRVADLRLDPGAFPDAAGLQENSALGRLLVSRTDADTDGDGDADQLVAFGARSLSVWDSELNLVADTGDLMERELAARTPTTFNGEGTVGSFDSRSDDRGPEPEGVTTGTVAGRPWPS